MEPAPPPAELLQYFGQPLNAHKQCGSFVVIAQFLVRGCSRISDGCQLILPHTNIDRPLISLSLLLLMLVRPHEISTIHPSKPFVLRLNKTRCLSLWFLLCCSSDESQGAVALSNDPNNILNVTNARDTSSINIINLLLLLLVLFFI